MTDLSNFEGWTTQELGYFIHDLRSQVIAFEAIRDDVDTRNRQMRLRQVIAELNIQFEAANAELDRRIAES